MNKKPLSSLLTALVIAGTTPCWGFAAEQPPEPISAEQTDAPLAAMAALDTLQLTDQEGATLRMMDSTNRVISFDSAATAYRVSVPRPTQTVRLYAQAHAGSTLSVQAASIEDNTSYAVTWVEGEQPYYEVTLAPESTLLTLHLTTADDPIGVRYQVRINRADQVAQALASLAITDELGKACTLLGDNNRPVLFSPEITAYSALITSQAQGIRLYAAAHTGDSLSVVRQSGGHNTDALPLTAVEDETGVYYEVPFTEDTLSLTLRVTNPSDRIGTSYQLDLFRSPTTSNPLTALTFTDASGVAFSPVRSDGYMGTIGSDEPYYIYVPQNTTQIDCHPTAPGGHLLEVFRYEQNPVSRAFLGATLSSNVDNTSVYTVPLRTKTTALLLRTSTPTDRNGQLRLVYIVKQPQNTVLRSAQYKNGAVEVNLYTTSTLRNAQVTIAGYDQQGQLVRTATRTVEVKNTNTYSTTIPASWSGVHHLRVSLLDPNGKQICPSVLIAYPQN